MLKNKEDLKNNGFIFDYGWKKIIKVTFVDQIVDVEIIFDTYKIEDEINNNQFETFYNIEEKFKQVILNGKNKIKKYLEDLKGNDIGENIKKYILPKQIILSQLDEKDEFGIYFDSILDEDGVGIKVKNNKIENIGQGDIVL